MKLFASVAFALLAVAASPSYAEQQLPAQNNAHHTMLMPSASNQSPFDFNHMAAGSDKSDELGVPYYNDNHR
ncbi:TPA: multiple antibiotic resistance protein MarB [Kluyvera cryocrescens]|uniref:Multiple antibiotic resistance protein MarB n=1 Tax=Kluyvera cryocrescens TaxID=580 RepID=A0AAW9C4D2_KLUCR|nr:multiple antibiotic resistance protein MarB [Kluyvera cryocrescens]MCX2866436.1 multiple antibiotic resistance protein MarB [Kluyvera cryocrescens]MDU5686711.1 multiple antibiotic resistance protein MarB [Kluyvera cryocrescens]MDW3777156.1 multiple antibiotic resistance protein MarB [Kluyvera cryocrescens]MEB6632547.1 multiple antibiotic resistance protein MarB [Kluyvera cryocrescens]MEB7556727.1 multiple antibiotic resistance protein MarB [Kluyvera cryocrescens]